jgi:hypothetical protein
MSDKNRTAKLDKIGYRRFTLLYGMLFVGVGTCLGTALLHPLLFPKDCGYLKGVVRKVVMLPLWLFGGYIWAVWSWRWMHRLPKKKSAGFPVVENDEKRE